MFFEASFIVQELGKNVGVGVPQRDKSVQKEAAQDKCPFLLCDGALAVALGK